MHLILKRLDIRGAFFITTLSINAHIFIHQTALVFMIEFKKNDTYLCNVSNAFPILSFRHSKLKYQQTHNKILLKYPLELNV